MSLLPSELNLTQEQLKAIGCVAIESARLDTLVARMIWLVSKCDAAAGEMHTDRLETGAKLQLLRDLTLSRIRRDKAARRFQRIYDGIRRVVVLRNTQIYGRSQIRFPRLSAANPVASGFRMGRARESKPIRAAISMSIARRFYKMHGELWNFYHQYATDLLPMPGKSA